MSTDTEVRLPRRRRRIKPEAEIVLICNPRAGGRWKELAGILDSDEARYARRIVTDSVEDVAAGLADLSDDTKLVCVYGGDGTIQRVLDRMPRKTLEATYLGFLGGGTMNVTARWLGYSRRPVHNFRFLVKSFRSGDLLWKEVPLMEVASGPERHRCFTFGMGPIVRLLDAYERGPKGKRAALMMVARAVSATVTGRPLAFRELLKEMPAEVRLDGEALPYEEFSALFANVTGQINPGVEPFTGDRLRDSFHCAAYAVSSREVVMALPLLIRGWLPIDLRALTPDLLGKAIPFTQKPSEQVGLPADARYVNRPVRHLEIKSAESIYTVDGEIVSTHGDMVTVDMGPTLKLAVGPGAAWRQGLRAAADRVTP
ncbi:MAG TPA: diacylglycerol kinase family protein [Kofleriaceae bacterium]|nr:diacylglycerol kinase family protein [Kofleriaceae bacterium]